MAKKETKKAREARLAEEAAAEAEDDEDGEDEAGGDLFDKPRLSGEGGFWPGKKGLYVAEIVRFAEGPVFENKGKDGTVEKRKSVRWVWDLFAISSVSGPDKRLTWVPDDGEHEGETLDVTADALTSRIISPKSSAGKWFSGFLNREIDFDNEDAGGLMAEAVGTRALVTYAKGENGKIKVGEGGVAALPDDDDDDEEDDE